MIKKTAIKITLWILRILGLMVILICMTIAAANLREQVNHKPIYGKLESNSEKLSSVRHTSSSFLFEWHGEQRQFLIYHKDDPAKVQWSSIPGESFLHAALGSEEFAENRGSFFLRNRIRKRFNIQRLDHIRSTENGIVMTGKLTGDRMKRAIDFEIEFAESGNNQLSFRASTASNIYNNRLYLTYQTDKDEQFFGLGTQYTHFNLKGKRVPIFVSEQGIGRGKQPLTFLVDLIAKSGGKWYTSYSPVPYYMTSRIRSIYLTTYDYAVFDLRKHNKVQISILSNKLEGSILVGDEPSDILQSYTEYTGRMPALPDWVNEGVIVGMQGGTDRVYEILGKLKEFNTPVAAFWLQDWVGQRTTSFGKQLWWNWTLDSLHYHNWDALVEDLSRDSIRVMGYINPFLVDISEKEHAGRDLLAEARDKDLLIKDKNGNEIMVQITSFSAAMLDLSKVETRDWITSVIHDEMMDRKFSGWMADFGEALPMDAYMKASEGSHGPDAKQFHNQYPEIWSALNSEAASADTSSEIVYFNRSGYTKSPGVNRLFWLGDQMTNWDRHDGIKTAVTGLLSSGISGYSLNHSDIGGYTAITNKPLHIVRDKELLLRWIELNAFTAVFRSHEGNRPEDNWQVYSDVETLAHFARFATIYKQLAPYRKELMKEAEETGMPLVRHPFLHYPQEEKFYPMSYQQFMLGPYIMICPVLDAGATEVDVFLPHGDWVKAFTGETYASTGMMITVDAPIGTPAVFYQEGSSVENHLR